MQLLMPYNDIATQMSKLDETIQYQKCISDSKIIAATLSVAQLDPNNLGLSIFNKPGIFTKIAGELAYMLKCRPREVKIRSTKKCYNEIPITHDDKDQFSQPCSRIIMDLVHKWIVTSFFSRYLNLTTIYASKESNNNVN